MDAALALADYNLGEADMKDIAGYFKGILIHISKQINIILNNLVRNVVK